MEFKNDTFTILNYQGSKKQLLEFIFDNIVKINPPNKAILDIFAGSGVVSYGLKRYFNIYSNDAEYYSYLINKALLGNNKLNESTKETFINAYNKNLNNLYSIFSETILAEEKFILQKNIQNLKILYEEFPLIWKDNFSLQINDISINNIENLRLYKNEIPYILFTLYYSTTYFRIKQAIELDSIRYAIEQISDDDKYKYFSALFYTMKEIVFSKDGHMAQPLDIDKNSTKMIKLYHKDTLNILFSKLQEFESNDYIETNHENKVYNYNFKELLKIDDIKKNIGTIYADPPYTDMQYSRYYHLLNVIAKYEYPDFSIVRGSITKGLYTEGRYQSDLSKRGKAILELKNIIKFSFENNQNIVISFAYPKNTEEQATNRYVFSIDELIQAVTEQYGEANTDVKKIDYSHANNRNSQAKSVYEYLVIGKRSLENE